MDWDWSKIAKNVWEGVKLVTKVMDESKFFGGNGQGGTTSLVSYPGKLHLPGRISKEISRSSAGTPGFGDISEASFYKYAQLQNTVRYLYSQKSKYQTIAKDKG